jgi:hypothetical protein
MKIEILSDSFESTFLDLIRNSNDQLLASPFIKNNIAQLILDNKPKRSQISFLTNYKLTNFYRHSSDLDALRSFIKSRIEVRNYPRLHAKTFIFDHDNAIITSANLTLGGFKHNYECGVLIHDSNLTNQLRQDFLRIFRNKDESSQVNEKILALTESILSKVPKEKKFKFAKNEADIFQEAGYDPQLDLYDGGEDTIRNSLSGWRRDVFNAIADIPKSVFKLDEMYAFKDRFQESHPRNRNIEAKIRQQLQELRDLGLIEFMGNGYYRKLWR